MFRFERIHKLLRALIVALLTYVFTASSVLGQSNLDLLYDSVIGQGPGSHAWVKQDNGTLSEQLPELNELSDAWMFWKGMVTADGELALVFYIDKPRLDRGRNFCRSRVDSYLYRFLSNRDEAIGALSLSHFAEMVSFNKEHIESNCKTIELADMDDYVFVSTPLTDLDYSGVFEIYRSLVASIDPSLDECWLDSSHRVREIGVSRSINDPDENSLFISVDEGSHYKQLHIGRWGSGLRVIGCDNLLD